MLSQIRSWFAGVRHRSQVERDMSDELAFHLQARTEHWIAQGLSSGEAARRARLEFGWRGGQVEDCRQARGLALWDDLRSAVRYAWRSLRGRPTFTILSVAILAVTIGANTAVFSVLDAVMFRMLPVEKPADLRELSWIEHPNDGWSVSYDGSMRPSGEGGRVATSFAYPVYAQIRDHTTVFSDLFLFTGTDVSLGVSGNEQRAVALLVSGNFLRGLGVRLLLGRGLEPDDDRPGAPPVAVLSYRTWQLRFGGDASVIGRTLTINGLSAVVVGVTPRAFFGVEPGSEVDVLAPLAPTLPVVEKRAGVLANARYWAFRVMGRVVPGVDERRVQIETEALARKALPADMSDDARKAFARLLVSPGAQGLDTLRHGYAESLYLLMGIMGAALLIACANIAGLLLTRATARQREMGLRLALGAGRARLVRQLLTETVILAACGAAVGVVIAVLTRTPLMSWLNQDEAPIVLPFNFGAWPLMFSIGLCLVVGLLCGVVPALGATRLGLAPMLKRTVSASPGLVSRLPTGKILVALQVALSLILVVSAGLFGRTLFNLKSQPLGFRPDHLLSFRVSPSSNGYENARLLNFYEQVLDRVAAVPGVRSATLSQYALIAGGARRDSISLPGQNGESRSVAVYIHLVAPHYFETMGIGLQSGREFTRQDREGAPPVALVNNALSRLMPAGRVALGQNVGFSDAPGSVIQIVGVADDARFSSLRDPAPPTVYLPYRQYPKGKMTFAVRTEGDPARASGAVLAAVQAVDRAVPVFDMQTQEAVIDAALRQERLFAYAAAGFAGFALFVACLGIYGSLSYAVARRTPEIGLRVALGATRSSVMMMVLRESIMPVLFGAVAGVAGAATATRLIASMMFGVETSDAPTFAACVAALVVSALAAAWGPCRRAARLDPVVALRAE